MHRTIFKRLLLQRYSDEVQYNTKEKDYYKSIQILGYLTNFLPKCLVCVVAVFNLRFY